MKPAGQPADGGGGRSDSNCAGAGTCDGVSVDAAILRSSASNSAHTCTSSASSRSASSTSSAPPPTAAVAVASAAAAATSSSAASSSALATSTAAWSAARSGPLPAWSSYSSTPSTPPLCAGGAGALLSASCTAAVARALAPASAGSKLQKAGGSRRPILTGLASYAHQCRSSATAATITLHAASLSSPPKLPLAPPRRRKRRVARAAAQSASESGSSCTSALDVGPAEPLHHEREPRVRLALHRHHAHQRSVERRAGTIRRCLDARNARQRPIWAAEVGHAAGQLDMQVEPGLGSGKQSLEHVHVLRLEHVEEHLRHEAAAGRTRLGSRAESEMW
eukprot:scaffold20571_cov111-Isochrysis_galbana.AAC.2